MTRFSRTNRLVQSPSSPSVPYLACSHDSNRDNPWTRSSGRHRCRSIRRDTTGSGPLSVLYVEAATQAYVMELEGSVFDYTKHDQLAARVRSCVDHIRTVCTIV